MSGDVLFDRLDQSFQAVVVQFLYRYQGVPDDVIERATAEARTDAGRWFVETYSLGVAEALRAAGSRVAQQLRAPSG